MKLLLIVTVLFTITVGATIFRDLAYFPKLESSNLRPAQVQAAGTLPKSSGLIPRQNYDACFPNISLNSGECIMPAQMPVAQAAAKLAAHVTQVYAFLPIHPYWTHVSLRENLGRIDVLIPEWYDFHPHILNLERLGFDEAPQTLDLIGAQRGRLKLLPAVRISTFNQAPVVPGAGVAERARRAAGLLLDEAERRGFDGMCLDFTRDWSDFKSQVDGLVRAFTEAFSKAGKESCLAMNFDALRALDPADTALADHVVVRVGRPAPGPGFPAALAPQQLIEEQARAIAARPDAGKIVAALDTLSAQWGSSAPVPAELSYVEAMSRLADAGAAPQTAGASLNSYAEFTDPNGQLQVIWMQDVVSTFNQVAAFAEHAIRRFAVWPVGGEDPAIWTLLSPVPDNGRAIAFTDLSEYVTYSGDGPLLGYAGYPATGTRSPSLSADGFRITDIGQIRMPAPHRLVRWGRVPDNTVVLTFDDGPDPAYTPAILDILKELDVPATFFLVGENINQNRSLVTRMVEDGHLVGSHSYSHANLSEISGLRSRIELAAVQKALEGSTGRNTLLFRMPYAWGSGPIDGSSAGPYGDVTASGYILVSGEVNPPDWEQLSAAGIVAFVQDRLADGSGNVIALHDSGGNRANVVAALRPLVEQLRQSGFRFVSLAEVLGASQEDLMPAMTASVSLLDRAAFIFTEYLTVVLEGAFWLVVAIGVARSVAILILSQLRKPHAVRIKVAQPAVSVLVPAFCEETVICKTVDAALASDYWNFDVIVVDDGSTDKTFDVLQRHFGANPRVKLIRKANGGKASALNLAVAHSDARILVAIDADTMIMADAIGRLVNHFSDPRIGAVAGNVKVGNRKGILGKFQALEYITAQNIDRRALELVNGILVVPGSIGAWRKTAVEDAGYYKSETLAEDADLTVSVIRSGYRVVFEPNAVAVTEAPETLRQFLAQRLRWILGMMQMGWKHKSAVLEGKGLGLIALPDLFFFGVVMPVLAPLADFAFIYAVYNLLTGGAVFHGTDATAKIVLAYLALPLLDVLIAVMAFQLEPRERRSLILLVPLQRFFYRQLLYYSALRALRRALTGRIVGWEKISRLSSVSALQAGIIHAGRDRPRALDTHRAVDPVSSP